MKSKTEFCIPLLRRQESYEFIISKVKEVYGTGISKSTLKEIIEKNGIIRTRKPRQRRIIPKVKDVQDEPNAYETVISGLELYNKAVKLRYFTREERRTLLDIILQYNNLKI